MTRRKPNPGAQIAMLRARITQGGDLNADTLSRSFGVPVREVEKLLQQNRKSS